MKSDKNCYPLVHFAPSYGWMNDPNGLVYHDGVYELYYQHNPEGTEWNRMTWGHARSRDLLHWKECGDVLYPDKNGTMFSGCAVLNERGLLGFPKDAILYFYTAAGHNSAESKGKPFSIRMAVSIDGGNTLEKYGAEVIPSAGWESRDPKVFYHSQTKAYIMVLWIKDNQFGIWRSEDLRCFKQTQVLSLKAGFECPDLFELPVIDDNDEICDKRFVFWAADGSYYVGSFDGYQFRQEQERKLAYLQTPGGILPYAAQSFSGMQDRVVMMAWLRTKCVADQTTGLMSIPRELGLLKKGSELLLYLKLPERIKELEGRRQKVSRGQSFIVSDSDGEKAIVVKLHFSDNDVHQNVYHGYHSEEIAWSLAFMGIEDKELLHIECLKDTQMLKIRHGLVTEFMEISVAVTNLELIYDRGTLEASGNRGEVYFVLDFPELRASPCREFSLESGKVEAECAAI
jgi:fructan beta-fructosidase